MIRQIVITSILFVQCINGQVIGSAKDVTERFGSITDIIQDGFLNEVNGFKDMAEAAHVIKNSLKSSCDASASNNLRQCQEDMRNLAHTAYEDWTETEGVISLLGDKSVRTIVVMNMATSRKAEDDHENKEKEKDRQKQDDKNKNKAAETEKESENTGLGALLPLNSGTMAIDQAIIDQVLQLIFEEQSLEGMLQRLLDIAWALESLNMSFGEFTGGDTTPSVAVEVIAVIYEEIQKWMEFMEIMNGFTSLMRRRNLRALKNDPKHDDNEGLTQSKLWEKYKDRIKHGMMETVAAYINTGGDVEITAVHAALTFAKGFMLKD